MACHDLITIDISDCATKQFATTSAGFVLPQMSAWAHQKANYNYNPTEVYQLHFEGKFVILKGGRVLFVYKSATSCRGQASGSHFVRFQQIILRQASEDAAEKLLPFLVGQTQNMTVNKFDNSHLFRELKSNGIIAAS